MWFLCLNCFCVLFVADCDVVRFVICLRVLCAFVCLCVFFHVSEGVVRDLLCGDVWFGFVCVVLVCVCSLFSNMCSL